MTIENPLFSLLILIIGMPIFIIIISKINSFSEQFITFYLGKGFRFFYSFIGTPIHELSHMIMCVLFMHKVEKFNLLCLNPNSEVLGYVYHSYNKKNFIARIGNLFIGTAPILIGFIVVFIIYDNFMKNPFTVSFWVSLLVISQIVTHMRCSKPDLINAFDGYIFCIILLLFSLFCFPSFLINISNIFLKLSFFILIISLLNLIILRFFIKLIKS